MKNINILYWIFTGIFSFFMFGSAVPDALVMDLAVKGFGELGFPAYLVPFLGIAKILGVIAILIPGYPRIKEWAYAGLLYDVIGAMYSVYSIGKPLGTWLPISIPIAFGFLSYVYYHKRLKAKGR
jgi:peptidoglycan/LPS O-acetylase OafA/YrhL